MAIMEVGATAPTPTTSLMLSNADILE